MTLLDVQNLAVSFGRGAAEVVAVRGVSFTLNKGETLALVGESGSGKSVTALSLLQLLPYPRAWHPSGSIRLAGEELIGAPERVLRRVRGNRVAMVFQEPMTSLNPLHSIEHQIGEVLEIHKGLSGAARRARVLELLALVGIPEAEKRLDALPHELSGGQRQRVMIAMALANEPDILIADEPTTALDVTTQAQILELIRRIQQERDLAVILITHDMGVIAEMADDVVVMYLGHEVEKGPVDAIFHAPRHPYTQALLRSIPSVLAEPRSRLATIAGSIPHPYARPSGCPFHPRCSDHIVGVCEKSFPAEIDIAERHGVACHLYTRNVEAAA